MKIIEKIKFNFSDFLEYIEYSDFISEENISEEGHLAKEVQEILQHFLSAKKENKDYIIKITATNEKGGWYENYFYSSEGLAENQIHWLQKDGFELLQN